jgi:hypothetical protein
MPDSRRHPFEGKASCKADFPVDRITERGANLSILGPYLSSRIAAIIAVAAATWASMVALNTVAKMVTDRVNQLPPTIDLQRVLEALPVQKNRTKPTTLIRTIVPPMKTIVIQSPNLLRAPAFSGREKRVQVVLERPLDSGES